MDRKHIMGHKGCSGEFVYDQPLETLEHGQVPTSTCNVCGLQGCFDYADEDVEDRGTNA